MGTIHLDDLTIATPRTKSTFYEAEPVLPAWKLQKALTLTCLMLKLHEYILAEFSHCYMDSRTQDAMKRWVYDAMRGVVPASEIRVTISADGTFAIDFAPLTHYWGEFMKVVWREREERR